MDFIDRILEQADIFELFDKSGVKYMFKNKKHNISCPFHGADRKASMTVFPETNTVYCFYCDKAWDAISFWAEVNEWWKEDDPTKLDMGRAISDLGRMYSIQDTKPDWKNSLDKTLGEISGHKKGYSGASMEERLRLKSFYAFRASKKLRTIPLDKRAELWDDISKLWDELDSLNLTSPTWKKDLSAWSKRLNGRVR